MNSAVWRHASPPPATFLRRLAAAAAIIGLGLAASGCAQSMSEFARNADTPSPVALTPGDAQTAGVARPAILVDERTVPAEAPRTTAPMAIAPAARATPEVAAVDPSDPGIAPAATNLNRIPEQPKAKLLTADEKAKVIAELEAMAKKQSAQLDKDKTRTRTRKPPARPIIWIRPSESPVQLATEGAR